MTRHIFLANGSEIRFWEWQREAYPRRVKTFFKQDDLERWAATAQVQWDPLNVPIDSQPPGPGHTKPLMMHVPAYELTYDVSYQGAPVIRVQ